MTTGAEELADRFAAIPNEHVQAAFADDEPDERADIRQGRDGEELQGIAVMAQIAALVMSDWFWEFCDAVFPNNDLFPDKPGPGAPAHFPDWFLFLIHCAASMSGHSTVKSAVVHFRNPETWNDFVAWVDPYVPQHMTRLRDLPLRKPDRTTRPVATPGTPRNDRTRSRAKDPSFETQIRFRAASTPPERHHVDQFNRRFRGKQKNGQPIPVGHRDYGIRDKALDQFRRVAVDQALAMGLLHPGARFFFRKPDRNQFVGVDGVVMPVQKAKIPKPKSEDKAEDSASDRSSSGQGAGKPPDQSAKKATKPSRADLLKHNPTADVHTIGDGTKVYGSKWTVASARVNCQYMSRLILDMRHTHKSHPGSMRDESRAVLDMLPNLRDLSQGGLRGLLVDSAVRGVAVTALQREGIVVVNYCHAESNPGGGPGRRLNPDRKEKSRLRLVATHIDGEGKQCQHPIFAVGGKLLELVATSDGSDATRPLPILDYERRGPIGKIREYLKVAITCGMGGDFTVRVPLFHTDATSTAPTDVNFGEVCRVFSPDSAEFKYLYGARNDTEARHSDLKARIKNLPRDLPGQQLRLLAAGMAINAIAWQVHLQAHREANILDGTG